MVNYVRICSLNHHDAVVVVVVIVSIELAVRWCVSVPPVSSLLHQSQSDASCGVGPAGSQTRCARLPEPAVPQVAHGAPGRGQGEGTEDPVHVPEGLLVFCPCNWCESVPSVYPK